MTNYTDHPDSILQPDKPVLASTQLEARDNLISAMEDGPFAPRKKYTITSGTRDSSAALNFTIPEGFTGAQMFIKSSGAADLLLSLSSDGSTYGATSTVFPSGGGGGGDCVLFVDFETGAYVANHSNSAQSSGTVAGFGSGVTHVRLQLSTGGDFVVISHWNGGAA